MDEKILIVCVAAAVTIGLIVVWIRSSGRHYRRLFSPAHYLEVATAVMELRAAALEHLATPDAPQESIARVLSSEGLVISYEIESDSGGSKHHFAVSLAGKLTPHAVGDRFSFVIASLIGLPVAKVAFFSTESTVHHGEALLTREEQDLFAARAVRPPTEAEINTLLEEFARNPIRCQTEVAG